MALKIKGITILLGGDTSGLVKALDKVEKELKDTQNALKNVNSALKFDPHNIELLTQKQTLLSKAIDETREKLRLEEEVALKAREALDAGKISQEAYANIIAQVETTRQELSGLQTQADETRQHLGDIDAGNIGQVGQSAEQAGQKMVALGGTITDVGKKLSGISKIAQKALGGMFNAAVDWEEAFTGVMKTVDETSTTSYEDLSKGIRELSTRTASSAEEIAAVAEGAGQLGVAADDVLQFTETMIRLGDSTNLSADDAASSIAKIYNILGQDLTTVDRFGSSIVALGNNFATTEADITEMTNRLAAAGSVVGLSAPQMLAVATALSSVGINAEAGGSAISKLLKQMDVATETFESSQSIINKTGMSLRELEMTQSLDGKAFKGIAENLGLTTKELGNAITNMKNLEKFADVAGVSGKEFVDIYGKDAVKGLGLFISGLKRIDSEGGSATATLQDMGLTEIRLSNAVLSLASSDDILAKTLDVANQAFEDNTALAEESEKRYGTTASQIAQTKASIHNMAIELGESLLPMAKDVLESIKELVGWFNGLDDSTKENIVKITAFTAVLSPALTAIGSLTTGVGMLKIALGGAGAAGAGASAAGAAAGSGLIGTLGAFLGPAGLIAGIVGGCALLGKALDGADSWAEYLEHVCEGVVQFYEDAKNTIMGWVNDIKQGWHDLFVGDPIETSGAEQAINEKFRGRTMENGPWAGNTIPDNSIMQRSVFQQSNYPVSGDTIIPVYIGGEKLATAVVNTSNRLQYQLAGGST